MTNQVDNPAVLRAVKPYPVVFVPNEYGGWDAFFPNFNNVSAFGTNFPLAFKAAQEELTRQFTIIMKEGGLPPLPSDPDKLVPDEDEPAGTRVEMVEPDKNVILSKLGLVKKRLKTSPAGQKYKP